MKELNDGKQMTDVWRMPAIGRWEKTCGKHPTQKPLRLLVRMILASTNQGDWILDPFCGSSTTGIAANLCGRRFAGIEQEESFCRLSKARREEIENPRNRLGPSVQPHASESCSRRVRHHLRIYDRVQGIANL